MERRPPRGKAARSKQLEPHRDVAIRLQALGAADCLLDRQEPSAVLLRKDRGRPAALADRYVHLDRAEAAPPPELEPADQPLPPDRSGRFALDHHIAHVAIFFGAPDEKRGGAAYGVGAHS